jgi:hypothetical protein
LSAFLPPVPMSSLAVEGVADAEVSCGLLLLRSRPDGWARPFLWRRVGFGVTDEALLCDWTFWGSPMTGGGRLLTSSPSRRAESPVAARRLGHPCRHRKRRARDEIDERALRSRSAHAHADVSTSLSTALRVASVSCRPPGRHMAHGCSPCGSEVAPVPLARRSWATCVATGDDLRRTPPRVRATAAVGCTAPGRRRASARHGRKGNPAAGPGAPGGGPLRGRHIRR